MATFGSQSLPVEYDRLLRAELEDGEQLVWFDQPSPGRMALQMAPIGCIGLVFGGFAAFWVVMASGVAFFGSFAGPGAAPLLLFPFFGVPFLIVAGIMIVSPILAYNNAKKSIYGLTNRRAIIISQGFSRTVKSYTAGDMDSIERSERSDGTGDVIFARQYNVNSRRNRSPVSIGFFGIRNPHDVERLVRQLVVERQDPQSTRSAPSQNIT